MDKIKKLKDFTLSCKTFLSDSALLKPLHSFPSRGRNVTNAKSTSVAVALNSLKLKQSARNIKKGFTLAEVLITLVVLGIVAAVTLPTLYSDMDEKQYRVPLRKLYATLSEAFNLTLNFSDEYNGDIRLLDQNTAMTFYGELSKHLSIAKFCCSDPTITSGTKTNPACFGKPVADDRCIASTTINANYNAKGHSFAYEGLFTDYSAARNVGMSFILKDGASVTIFPADNSKDHWGLANERSTISERPGVEIDVNGPQNGPNMQMADLYLFVWTKDDGLLPAGIDYVAGNGMALSGSWSGTAKRLYND